MNADKQSLVLSAFIRVHLRLKVFSCFPVAAAKVNQRLAVGDSRVYHFAHQNIVIAHGHDPVDGALDCRQHARQQGHSGYARLDKAEKGPSYGPFDTADEMIAHMKAELKKRAAASL